MADTVKLPRQAIYLDGTRLGESLGDVTYGLKHIRTCLSEISVAVLATVWPYSLGAESANATPMLLLLRPLARDFSNDGSEDLTARVRLSGCEHVGWTLDQERAFETTWTREVE